MLTAEPAADAGAVSSQSVVTLSPGATFANRFDDPSATSTV